MLRANRVPSRLEKQGERVGGLGGTLDVAQLRDEPSGDFEFSFDLAAAENLQEHEILPLLGLQHDGGVAIGQEIGLAEGNAAPGKVLGQGSKGWACLFPVVIERNHLDGPIPGKPGGQAFFAIFISHGGGSR